MSGSESLFVTSIVLRLKGTSLYHIGNSILSVNFTLTVDPLAPDTLCSIHPVPDHPPTVQTGLPDNTAGKQAMTSYTTEGKATQSVR